MSTYSKGGKEEGFWKETREVLRRFRECLLLTKETRQAPLTQCWLWKGGKEAWVLNRDSGGPENLYEESDRGRDFKQRPRKFWAPITEGKGKGYETEDSGSPDHLIGRERKRQGFETGTQEVLRTYRKGAGIWNRDSGGPEHLKEGRERGKDLK